MLKVGVLSDIHYPSDPKSLNRFSKLARRYNRLLKRKPKQRVLTYLRLKRGLM
jgi:hypothetical protein